MGSNPTGIKDFFSFSVWAHFLSRAIAQKVLFGIFAQNFNLPHLMKLLTIFLLSGHTLIILVTPSLTCLSVRLSVFVPVCSYVYPSAFSVCLSVCLSVYICIIVLSGQTLLVNPSLTCSFAANHHLNFPRPALIWPQL